MDNRELKMRREIKSFGIKYVKAIGTILQTEADDLKINIQDLKKKYIKYQDYVNDWIYLDWVFGELDVYFNIIVYPIPKLIIIPINIPIEANEKFLELARRGKIILDNGEAEADTIMYEYTIDKTLVNYEK